MNRRLDFMIIGTQKGGTTALFRYMGQHPDVFVPEAKEIHYFSNPEFHAQGPEYLHTFYSEYGGEQVVGGAYVHLLHYAESAKTMWEYNSEMKLIAVLRNPIDRAYSAYWFAVRNGWESAETFEEALELEASRLKGTRQEQTELTYLNQGKYAQRLQPFLDQFGTEQLRVVFQDNLRADPGAAVRETLQWLGVEREAELNMSKPVNVAGMPRFRRLQRVLLQENQVKRALRKVTTPGFRWQFQKRIVLPLVKKNVRPVQYQPMKEETRTRLIEYFAPYNRELEALLGADVPHWNH
jgi:hypothetical protein